MSDLIRHLASQIDIVGVLFSLVFVFWCLVMWRWQVDDKVTFDIRDVVMVGGRVSADRMKEWVAFIAMTFIVVHEEFKGTMTEWLFSGYGLIWVAKGISHVLKGTPMPDKEPPTDAKS